MYIYMYIHVHVYIHVQFIQVLFFLYSATSLTLRSDVYVDTIYRIEITTRTRELLLEEEPEKFEVRAFDDEGTCTYSICQ